MTFADYDQNIKTEVDQLNRKPIRISVVGTEKVQSHRSTRISRQTRVKNKSA